MAEVTALEQDHPDHHQRPARRATSLRALEERGDVEISGFGQRQDSSKHLQVAQSASYSSPCSSTSRYTVHVVPFERIWKDPANMWQMIKPGATIASASMETQAGLPPADVSTPKASHLSSRNVCPGKPVGAFCIQYSFRMTPWHAFPCNGLVVVVKPHLAHKKSSEESEEDVSNAEYSLTKFGKIGRRYLGAST